jgi:Ribose/xylose/arabinose/galactoside ABC-type transport systems, permease components
MENNKSNKFMLFFNSYRGFIFLAVVLFFGIFAKNFFTVFNMSSILHNTSLNIYLGLAFTLCMIAGHMDLSVGYMATTGMMVALGMRTLSGLPWVAAIAIAVGIGVIVGIINGLLVTKAKIHSFIVTLGMQFVLRGGMYIYCNGAEISVKKDFALSDFLKSSPIKFLPFTWLTIITLSIVAIFAIVLTMTRFGRNVHMLGGNLETAWLAGVGSDFVTILVFALSSAACALGGALYGISAGTGNPTFGEKGIAPLMIALTATIIGGCDINGGKGKVTDTAICIIAINAMYSVVMTLTGKVEVQVLLIGLVLAACVIYETYVNYQRQKVLGIRQDLLKKYMQETGKTKL